MKVTVKEEPAWKRVLEIELPAEAVTREVDAVVADYRRRLVFPGFRQGKVPADLARRHMGESLEGEVLRRLIPKAFSDAVHEQGLKPVGDPHVSNLRHEPGGPMSFTVTVEVLPQVEVQGYEGLKLSRDVADIKDEELSRVLDGIREREADLEPVDRPAHGGDVVLTRYFELEAGGGSKAGQEPREAHLEIGGSGTPEVMSRELMGTVVGEMKKIVLAYPPDHPDPELAGHSSTFQVTVVQVKEKVWPVLDDTLARKVLQNEEATLEDLKARIRLNLEVETRMRSVRELEEKLVARLLELNPFDIPAGMLETSLDEFMVDLKTRYPNLPPDEEAKARDTFRSEIQTRIRRDILLEAVGRREKIEVTEEELNTEIEAFAQQEEKNPAQVKARLKKDGGFDRLRQDLYYRRVIDRLVEKADVTIIQGSAP